MYTERLNTILFACVEIEIAHDEEKAHLSVCFSCLIMVHCCGRKCLFAQIFENIHQGWNLKLAARLKLCSTEPLPMYRNRKGLANGPSCLLNDELCDVILLFCRIDFYSGFKLLFMPKGNCRAYHSDAIHWSNIDRGTTSVSGL